MYKIPANTLFMGKNLVYVPECHSTNTLAAELCQRSSTIEGTMIVTDSQTKGRGQRGNEWYSEPYKNLTISVILKPVFIKPGDQFNLTIAISLALRDYLTRRVAGVIKIKWPNDILLNGKKVCGILIENSIKRDVIQQSVVGIGLNVNQLVFESENASSMKLAAGHDFVLPDELSLLMALLEQRYLQLRSGKIEQLKGEYLNVLYAIGERRKFTETDGEVEGTIVGITQQGMLMMAVQGHIRSYDLKQIRFAD